MYENEVNVGLNADEISLLIDILDDYDYASVAEQLLVNGLIDKLTDTEEI